MIYKKWHAIQLNLEIRHLWNAINFLTFTKIISKTLSRKYSQKLLDHVTKSATDAIKTTSKWAIKKNPAETTVDLIGNKIANKITKNSSQTEEKSLEIPKDTHL